MIGSQNQKIGVGFVGFHGISMVMGLVMDERNGGYGFVKKMKMKVVEDGNNCVEVIENIFTGGHSTFDILFFGLMNL